MKCWFKHLIFSSTPILSKAEKQYFLRKTTENKSKNTKIQKGRAGMGELELTN